MYEAYLAEWYDFGNAMVEEVKRYLERTKKSREIYEKINEYIPLGVNSNQRYYKPYPIYFDYARGSRIWDVDGNEYIDFNMGYGALIVGHSHPKLVSALKKQVENGILYTHPHRLLEELSELIVDIFDFDMFRISNSGSEAVMFAIRLARAYTGRDKIIKIEGSYHGTYDYMLVSSWPTRGLAGPRRMPVSVIESLGLPEDIEELVYVVPYNDIEPLKELLEEEGDDIAGLIMEPIMMNAGIIYPKEGYLRDVRRLTEEYDIVLIFDEVKTGMRAHPGTAAQLLGVEPDVITLAKAVGGGAPVSIVGGNEDIMSLIAPTHAPRFQGVIHAGTYNANPLALVSLYVTLSEILTDEVYRGLIKYNQMIRDAYEDAFGKYGIDAYVETFGVSGSIIFSKDKVYNFRQILESDLELWYPLFFHMINNGVLPMATGPEEMWTISVQHSDLDVERYIEMIDESIKLMAEIEDYMLEDE
jgi:glutamate-1-semialdehyde 2,1-aminomutase